MSNDDMERPREYSDGEVASAYRTLANEKSPDHLDTKILRTASNAAASRTGIFRITAWLRPLAFAATAGLSIALLLELNETQFFDLSTENPALMPAADSDGENLSDTTAPDKGNTDNFRNAAGQARDQVREVGASETATLKEMPKSTTGDGEAAPAQQEALAAGSDAGQNPTPEVAQDVDVGQAKSSVSEPSGCTAEQRDNPGDWMACIDELERAGLNDMAAREVMELRRSFPQFLVQ